MQDPRHSFEQRRTMLIVEDVLSKAEATPSLTAVRYDHCAVTYGVLAEAYVRYAEVVSRHSIKPGAALPASVLHCLPDVGKLAPARAVGVIGEILDWLGRNVPRDEDGRGHGSLRAVS